jgi:DNA-binding NarL/FixJ family response regulator
LQLYDVIITIGGAMAKISNSYPRLLIIDASIVFYEGIAAIVNRTNRFEICREPDQGKSAADLVEAHQPDLVLIDPFTDGVDGVWLIKALAESFPQTQIIVVSQRPEEVYAERVLRAGARGFWMKSGGEKELICCLDTVLADEIYLSPRMTLFAVHRFVAAQRVEASLVEDLTDRELHVFGLIGAGNGPGQIAGDLKLSRKTIETYQDRIKTKLGHNDARELRDGARRWITSIGA